MANVHEIDMTIKDIETDEDRHDPHAWARRIINLRGEVCGTAMCAAGFTVVRHGYELVFHYSPTALTTQWCQLPGGRPVPIAETAQRILGLSDNEAQIFFAGQNTLDDLRAFRDQAAEEGYIYGW